MPPRLRPSRAAMRSGAGIAVAMGVMNLATYGFTVAAARLLGPQPYGALAGLMATLLVIGVLQLAAQATAARRISSDPGDVRAIERVVLRVTYGAAFALGLVLLLATPLVDRVLQLSSLATAALVAVAAVPITIMGGQAGVLQGERRWRPLGVVYLASGVPRLVLGVLLISWSPTETSAMLAVALSSFAPVLVGWWALRSPGRPPVGASEEHVRDILLEALTSSQALLAFFSLSNVDVIVARNVLSEHQAGLYAGGLILTKAVLFLPQFVVVLAFPSLASPQERRDVLVRSLVLVAGIGAACTLGAAALPQLALAFVGGHSYGEIAGRLWLFALLGTVLALLQLLVYSVLARQGRRSVGALWIGLALLVGLGLLATGLDRLLLTVLAVDAALLVGLTLASLRILAAPEPAHTAA